MIAVAQKQTEVGANRLALVVKHLSFLISHDTCNPPRAIRWNDPIFVGLEAFFKTQGFTVTMADFGDGHVAFYARRGQAKTLFNVHLDTVPVSDGWTHDPFTLTTVGDRLHGRGVCDIKGAAACLMAVAETSDEPLAVLFTTDEEGANNCCVNLFLDSQDCSGYEQVVVAEPTGCQAILQHRGYVSAQGVFKGLSGHSSSVKALAGNAIHRANQWLQKALSVASAAQTATNPAGWCFNLGSISGGEKNNMIAEQCQLGFSLRVPAGQSSEAAFETLSALATSDVAWHCSMLAPALPGTPGAEAASKAYCEQHNLVIGDPVDFWTEASLFAVAGLPALVLGPGNIEQAHTVDEWVAADQLVRCFDIYRGLL